MSVRGIIAIGLLDSPSEIITLGLDADFSSTSRGHLVTIERQAADRIAITRSGADKAIVARAGADRVTINPK